MATGDRSRKRRRKEIRQRDDDLVRVALRLLYGEKTLGAGATRLVHRDQRLLHQIVLGDDALNQPRHLVGAAAGAGRNYELDRFGRLPCGGVTGGGKTRRNNGARYCNHRA
jgi:hypothetical protein